MSAVPDVARRGRTLTWWFLSTLVAVALGTGAVLLTGASWVRGEIREQSGEGTANLTRHEAAPNPHVGAAPAPAVAALRTDVRQLQEDVGKIKTDVAVTRAILRYAMPAAASRAEIEMEESP